jgi:hypothetical protein
MNLDGRSFFVFDDLGEEELFSQEFQAVFVGSEEWRITCFGRYATHKTVEVFDFLLNSSGIPW